MATQVSELKSRILQRADMENSSFVDNTTELLRNLNSSAEELYDLLISRFEDYFIKDPALSFTLSGTNKSSLPTDFYKVRGIDMNVNSKWVPLDIMNFSERASYDDTDPVDGTYRLWYIPTFPKFTGDSDTVLQQMAPWEEFLVIDGAIKALEKEESDTSNLKSDKAAMIARIQAMASGRQSSPERIADIRDQRSINYVYRLMGANIFVYKKDTANLVNRIGYY